MAQITNATLATQAPIRFFPRHARLAVVEARPTVQVVFLLRYVIGAASPAHAHAVSLLRLTAGGLAWWLAVIAAYLVNGVMDVKEDRANGSARPIATGALPVRTAAALTALAAVGSLVSAAWIPGLAVWVAAFLLLGWLYSAPPLPAKRWSTACAVVVFGLGWTSFAGGAATTGDGLSPAGLVAAGALSTWMALVGSVVKDLSDVDGDATGGRKTVAVRHGAASARALGVAGALIVGVCSVLASIAWAPSTLIGTTVLAVGAVCVVVQILRTARVDPADKHRHRSAYRAFMRTQYVANSVLLLFALIRGSL
ncbi:UbiA family prenyltransferase [Streptomyces sp. cg35]|uniref:UbiA family prenyltransferase n=1 Tax=Streptomyces sp. cg35 TaxID=3421650 RepID=UPI003D162DAB